MAQQLNYHPSESIALTKINSNASWNSTGNFDYDNVANPRLAFDADRCIPPREGQLFPVAGPLFGV